MNRNTFDKIVVLNKDTKAVEMIYQVNEKGKIFPPLKRQPKRTPEELYTINGVNLISTNDEVQPTRVAKLIRTNYIASDNEENEEEEVILQPFPSVK